MYRISNRTGPVVDESGVDSESLGGVGDVRRNFLQKGPAVKSEFSSYRLYSVIFLHCSDHVDVYKRLVSTHLLQ